MKNPFQRSDNVSHTEREIGHSAPIDVDRIKHCLGAWKDLTWGLFWHDLIRCIFCGSPNSRRNMGQPTISKKKMLPTNNRWKENQIWQCLYWLVMRCENCGWLTRAIHCTPSFPQKEEYKFCQMVEKTKTRENGPYEVRLNFRKISKYGMSNQSY
jgi:hypothetical protein